MNECCGIDIYAIKKGNQVGIFCKSCNGFLRWANKKERKLIRSGEIELLEEKNDNQ